MIESLQKALDEVTPHCQSIIDFKKLFSVFQKEKVIAEEKNVEYAKLVAAQAKEYAEKMAVVEAKEFSLRKQFQDLIDNIPIDLRKVGKKYECYSAGTKRQWIEWIVRYNTVLQAFDETFAEDKRLLVDRKQFSDQIAWMQEHGIDENFSCVLFLKELLAGSGEPLNLALAFTDVKKKKGSGSAKK